MMLEIVSFGSFMCNKLHVSEILFNSFINLATYHNLNLILYGTKETPQKRAVKADDLFNGKNLNNVKLTNSSNNSNISSGGEQLDINSNSISIVNVQQKEPQTSPSSSSIFNILQDQRNRKSKLFSSAISTTKPTYYADQDDELFTPLDYKKKLSSKFSYDLFKFKQTTPSISSSSSSSRPTTTATTSNMKNYNQRYDYYSGGSDDATVDDDDNEDQDLESYQETNSNNYNDLEYDAKESINYDNSDYILNGEDKESIKNGKIASSLSSSFVTLKTKLKPSVKPGESVVPFKAFSSDFQLNNERSSISQYSTSFSLSYSRMYKCSNVFHLLFFYLFLNFHFENFVFLNLF
jgi:hypothetical protein